MLENGVSFKSALDCRVAVNGGSFPCVWAVNEEQEIQECGKVNGYVLPYEVVTTSIRDL